MTDPKSATPTPTQLPDGQAEESALESNHMLQKSHAVTRVDHSTMATLLDGSRSAFERGLAEGGAKRALEMGFAAMGEVGQEFSRQLNDDPKLIVAFKEAINSGFAQGLANAVPDGFGDDFLYPEPSDEEYEEIWATTAPVLARLPYEPHPKHDKIVDRVLEDLANYICQGAILGFDRFETTGLPSRTIAELRAMRRQLVLFKRSAPRIARRIRESLRAHPNEGLRFLAIDPATSAIDMDRTVEAIVMLSPMQPSHRTAVELENTTSDKKYLLLRRLGGPQTIVPALVGMQILRQLICLVTPPYAKYIGDHLLAMAEETDDVPSLFEFEVMRSVLRDHKLWDSELVGFARRLASASKDMSSHIRTESVLKNMLVIEARDTARAASGALPALAAKSANSTPAKPTAPADQAPGTRAANNFFTAMPSKPSSALREAEKRIEKLGSEREALEQSLDEATQLNDFLRAALQGERAPIESSPEGGNRPQLNDLKGVLVGGHENFHAKVRKVLPNIRIIHPDVSKVDLSIFEDTDYVAFSTQYSNHRLFYQTYSAAKQRTRNLIYIEHVNIQRLLDTLCEECGAQYSGRA